LTDHYARGRFITFEGGEGTGKSTQIRLLAERLNTAGIRAITTREPGGSTGAEIIRHMLLAGMGKLLGPMAETLLFAAARDDHVCHVIEPALRGGIWVLCDRFTDSTRVYQGQLGSVDPAFIDALERVTIGYLEPDVTVILDVPVEIGLARAAARRGAADPDRFESEGREFHERLRQAYLDLARAEPERCVVVAADAEVDAVAARVWDAVQSKLDVPAASSSAAGM
jgi:dTMP kinase